MRSDLCLHLKSSKIPLVKNRYMHYHLMSGFTARHCFMEPDFTGNSGLKKRSGIRILKPNRTMEMSWNLRVHDPARTAMK